MSQTDTQMRTESEYWHVTDTHTDRQTDRQMRTESEYWHVTDRHTDRHTDEDRE